MLEESILRQKKQKNGRMFFRPHRFHIMQFSDIDSQKMLDKNTDHKRYRCN